MKYTYRVYTYDVWGNEEDGYEVNDVFRTSETVELDSKGTIQQDIEELIEQGILIEKR
jgi:hypothetical protein